MDKAEGKMKEAYGALVGDEAKKEEGRALQRKAQAQAEAAGGTLASVERYEVLVNEAPSAGPISGVTDTVGGVTQPVSGATDTVSGVTDTVGGTTGDLLGGEEKKS